MTEGLRVLTFSASEAVLAGIDATMSGDDSDGPGLSIVAKVRRYEQVTPAIRDLRVDVVVLHGIDRDRIGAWGHRRRPVAVLAGDDWAGADLLHALREGIIGIVSLDTDLVSLGRACRDVASGVAYISPPLLRVLLNHIAGTSEADARERFCLTIRELQVLRHLAAGRSPSEIAGSMNITSRTVKHHLGNVYRKLSVRDRTQAIVLAYREGLVC